MITCEKASIICHKAQYREATLWEKFKLEYHLLLCKTCSKFSKKNATLTSLCEQAKLNRLSEEEKMSMKQRIRDHI